MIDFRLPKHFIEKTLSLRFGAKQVSFGLQMQLSNKVAVKSVNVNMFLLKINLYIFCLFSYSYFFQFFLFLWLRLTHAKKHTIGQIPFRASLLPDEHILRKMLQNYFILNSENHSTKKNHSRFYSCRENEKNV